MVKFMIPGNDKGEFRMGGHGYQGGVVYDNDFCRLPLKEIAPFILKDEVEVEEKLEEEPKEEPQLVSNSPEEEEKGLNSLKEHIMNTWTVKDLKVEAKKLGIRVAGLREADLVTRLIEEGFKG